MKDVPATYLKSTYVEELHNEERVVLSEMDPLLESVSDNRNRFWIPFPS